MENKSIDAGTMIRLLAHLNCFKVSILLAICLLLDIENQAFGQSSRNKAICGNVFSSWGTDSLYQMSSGVRGAASCATSSCHGGPKAGVASAVAARGSEYPTWFENDPHAQAWKTISSDASAKILSKLGILSEGSRGLPELPRVPQHRFEPRSRSAFASHCGRRWM
jgi:hypothetical protein